MISDIRFENEKKMLEKLGGKLIVIYKKDEDLILTEQDKHKHPSKWKFLTFLEKDTIFQKNNSTLESLYNKIQSIQTKLE